MKRIFLLLLVYMLAAPLFVPYERVHSLSVLENVSNDQTSSVYNLIPADWGIYNDGTHPVETTQGLNDALKWAHENGKTTFKVPAGTYLIKKQDPKLYVDSSARINMVPNMTFELDNNAIIQKESNGFTGYHTLHVGYGADNVTLKGGIYRGDKDSHDYSSGGTHEGGVGISTEGAKNLTIDGVKAEQFIGDGLYVGGHGTMVQDLYENSFMSGSIDDKGEFIADSTKIRLKSALDFKHPIFKTEREFEFSNNQKLSNTFDIYFYKEDGTFMTRLKDQKVRQIMQIPDGASYFYTVFNQSASPGAYIEFWQRAVTRNAVVMNSEFAFNRRQGITISGGDNITISNNELHDIKGTAPQAGIDVEAGYGENGFLNSHIFIKNNHFYNNAVYDVILYDGQDATVEGNYLGSKNKIGLAVSPPFKGALIKDNHFDGSSIYAYHDVKFEGNQMNNSFTHLEGPNLSFDGMTFTDSRFIISSTVPFGITASNITMYNNNSESDMSLWVNPVHLSNITMYGGGISGNVPEGSIIDNLKVYGTDSLNLPPGTYNHCEIEASSGGTGVTTLDDAGSYIFNDCSFKVKEGLLVSNENADVLVSNSTFDMVEKRFALKAVNAKRIQFENNTVTSNKLENASDYLIMIGDYWTRADKSAVQEAIIKSNTITTNVPSEGISTIYSGIGAPAYTIEDNVLVNAKLKIRESDISNNNVEK
ncbi:right-handed parallel beta-helix repeat-containing protein [Paenibacillus radicis (ex Xue et al. 2023)]|uniref:Right-handed parallel beta-helix repeat-containing protein n=1 Tax=Paenibacillus radicis (ex Xue et al. 2023) TaxID=2972489 RepID=A0ABT1YQB4_9BACL|nr:right-handed parallel beta-helix repeat-containing protein [Paenibacillus radicis (ex Xue et al. 2023)]MCR8635373.1 right-handed parallel beta-helix repeat-containing protein [Paenibacillus radicis (ex Xue et al. 2023)]